MRALAGFRRVEQARAYIAQASASGYFLIRYESVFLQVQRLAELPWPVTLESYRPALARSRNASSGSGSRRTVERAGPHPGTRALEYRNIGLDDFRVLRIDSRESSGSHSDTRADRSVLSVRLGERPKVVEALERLVLVHRSYRE